jgi:hypothetical protein
MAHLVCKPALRRDKLAGGEESAAAANSLRRITLQNSLKYFTDDLTVARVVVNNWTSASVKFSVFSVQPEN